MYGLYVAIIRVFWLTTPKSQLIPATILGLYVVYHFYYMSFVSFDYGYNQTVVVVVGIVHSLLWIYWIVRARLPYASKNLLTQVSMWMLAMLEIFDFAPVFGSLDAHALWHVASIVPSLLWYQFIAADTEYCLKKAKSV
jgi:hypothetical protein